MASICGETREVFFGLAAVRDAGYLTNLIEQNFVLGSRVVIDGLVGFNRLASSGFIH